MWVNKSKQFTRDAFHMIKNPARASHAHISRVSCHLPRSFSSIPHPSTLVMFQFLRRVSGSLLPRPDRPWRDDGEYRESLPCPRC